MRILVLSDSHGRRQRMKKVFAGQSFDAAIFLGDGLKDFLESAALHPSLLYYSVAGNCDPFARENPVKIIEIEKKRIFLTHGHLHQVKSGLNRLKSSARETGAEIVLYGHTHRSDIEYDKELLLMNPGSLGDGRGSYGILEITSAGVNPRIMQL